jgi:N-ethylmaleimide reductase
VGVRLSPYGTFNDMGDSDPVALFTAAIAKLNPMYIGLSLVQPAQEAAIK